MTSRATSGPPSTRSSACCACRGWSRRVPRRPWPSTRWAACGEARAICGWPWTTWSAPPSSSSRPATPAASPAPWTTSARSCTSWDATTKRTRRSRPPSTGATWTATRSLALSISSLGNIQKARGRFDEAQRCYQQALEIRRDIGDRLGATATLNNLAVLAWERGDLDHARSGWLQTLDEAEGIGALPLAALALCNLGELALAKGDHEEGRRRASEALDIAREIDERRVQAEAMRILAQAEKALGDVVQARELAHRAHALAATAGLRQSEARALICLGEVLSASAHDAETPAPEDARAARACYERGITLLRELGNEAELARALERVGRHQVERGEHATGKGLLREALEIYGRLHLKQRQDVESFLASL